MTTTSVGSLTNSNHRDVETNTNFRYELWRQSPENGDDNINVDEIDVAHRIEKYRQGKQQPFLLQLVKRQTMIQVFKHKHH